VIAGWQASDIHPGWRTAEMGARRVDARMEGFIVSVASCQQLARASATDIPHQSLGCDGEVWTAAYIGNVPALSLLPTPAATGGLDNHSFIA